jgi:hypothetical protein
MMRRVGFLVFSGMLAVQQITQVTAIAQDQKFTCQVYGGSSVLDDSDFQALANQQITREKFASFAPRSKERIEVCDTRKLWRVIKSGNATRCDWTERYPKWNAELFSPAEQEAVFRDQARIAGTPIIPCR